MEDTRRKVKKKGRKRKEQAEEKKCSARFAENGVKEECTDTMST